jgi:hypothetical protein
MNEYDISNDLLTIRDTLRMLAERLDGLESRHKPRKRERGGVNHVAQPLAPSAGQHAPDFKYNGGAVLRCPQIYGAFWGPQWSDAAHTTRSNHLAQFMKDLLASKYMNVLSQYGVGSGAGAAGAYVKSTFVSNVPAQLTGTKIHQIIQDCINAGVIPEPPNTNSNICVMIFLDESIAVQDTGITMCEPSGDNAFGYHYDFLTAAGNEFYYAVIPALNDICLKASCSSDAGCSLHLAQAQEQRITQVASHEFIEMATDPKFQKGWWGPTSDENGDICNGQTASITVGPNTWAVQRQYSKADDVATNGGTWSVVDAPNPIPELAGGPTAGIGGVPPVARLQLLVPQVASLLPLPNSYFDAATKTMRTDPAELAAYATRLFHPFDHRNLVPGLPGLLRQMADYLDNKR